MTPCGFNVGLASQTVVKHWDDLGGMTHVSYDVSHDNVLCWVDLYLENFNIFKRDGLIVFT